MRRTEEEWAKIVARYRRSGRSARGFSAEEGISQQSLRDWTRKLDRSRSIQSRSAPGFVEIRGTAQAGSGDGREAATLGGDGLIIRFASGIDVEVKPATDRELLGWVLMCVRQL